MSREAEIETLYQGLAVLVRRSRELSSTLHPGLTLVAYSFLRHVETHEASRAADLVDTYGLDKSTVSRQINQLEADGFLRRTGERPGRRGQILELTATGTDALSIAADSIRTTLTDSLATWDDEELHTLANLVGRFNERLAITSR